MASFAISSLNSFCDASRWFYHFCLLISQTFSDSIVDIASSNLSDCLLLCYPVIHNFSKLALIITIWEWKRYIHHQRGPLNRLESKIF